MSHLGGRGRGDCQRRRIAKFLERAGQEEVVGPEVVAPHRDAVGLVDHDQANAARPDRVKELGLPEPLGCGIDQAKLAAAHAGEPSFLLVQIERAVDVGRLGTQRLGQVGELVVHQGNQRRDHHDRTIEQQRRDLESQRLAGPGRHDCQRIEPIEAALDDFSLARAELVVAEDVAERVEDARVGPLRLRRDQDRIRLLPPARRMPRSTPLPMFWKAI